MPKLPSKAQKRYGVELALKQTKTLIRSEKVSHSKGNTRDTKPKQ